MFGTLKKFLKESMVVSVLVDWLRGVSCAGGFIMRGK